MRGQYLALALLSATPAAAEMAISANDGKAALIDGRNVVPTFRHADSISILELSGTPHVIAELNVPASVIGPPSSVAIARDESFAIISAATKIDPKKRGQTIPDDTVTVVSLKGASLSRRPDAARGRRRCRRCHQPRRQFGSCCRPRRGDGCRLPGYGEVDPGGGGENFPRRRALGPERYRLPPRTVRRRS